MDAGHVYGDSLSRQLKLRLQKDGKLKYQVDLPNTTLSLLSLFPAVHCTTMRLAPLCTEHQSFPESQILRNVTLSLFNGENGMFVCVLHFVIVYRNAVCRFVIM